jgi:hypothetical protein
MFINALFFIYASIFYAFKSYKEVRKMYNKNKKGQAAMEFLMTYGWAILAAIVVIAVLAIYFRPSSLVSSQAVISAPWYVEGYNLQSADGVHLQLKNNGGEQYTITSIDVINAKMGNAAATCTPVTAGGSADVVAAGDLSDEYTIGCGTAAGDVGKTFSGDIVVKYKKGDDTSTAIDLQSTGSLSGKLS